MAEEPSVSSKVLRLRNCDAAVESSDDDDDYDDNE